MSVFYSDIKDYTNRFDMAKFMSYNNGYISVNSYFLHKLQSIPVMGYYKIAFENFRIDTVSYVVYEGLESLWWILLWYNGLSSWDKVVSGKLLKLPSIGDLETLILQCQSKQSQKVKLETLIASTTPEEPIIPIPTPEVPTIGALLKFDGTKYVPLPKGDPLQVLRVKSDGSDLEYATLNLIANSTATKIPFTGIQNSSNKVFTLGNTILPNTEFVYLNGSLLSEGSTKDYTLSGNLLIFTNDFVAPEATDILSIYGSY